MTTSYLIRNPARRRLRVSRLAAALAPELACRLEDPALARSLADCVLGMGASSSSASSSDSLLLLELAEPRRKSLVFSTCTSCTS